MKYSMFQIMMFDPPNDGHDYMILESIKSDPKNEFKIGRSIETDMKIADISVSRVHSYIRVVDDQLVLDDNGSKFGTLVKIMKPFPILRIRNDNLSKEESKYYFQSSIFQIGRTMIYFKFYD